MYGAVDIYGTKYYGCDARQPKCVTKGVFGKPLKTVAKAKAKFRIYYPTFESNTS